MSNDIQLLTNRLLAALNSNYEVIDMSSVLSVITQLEQTTVTKEQLEATRLGKFINLLRGRTWSGPLARRAKNLLKKWRDMLITPVCTTQPQMQQQLSTGITLESQSHQQRISHPLHVSLSQPTSPVAQSIESQRASRHHLAPPRRIENSSMPEYPCCNSSSMNKNVPSTSKKQQQRNLSNGGQHGSNNNNNTDQASSSQRSQSSKGMTSKPSNQSHQSSKKQPISFANLIESQFHPPGPGRSSAGPSFLMEDNRSQSPLTLPRIPLIPRDRQSPMIIEHSVSPLDLDQNSNPSREGSLAPPSIVSGPANLVVMNNNNTISSCSRLLNGDYAATTSVDLHDSNSNSNMTGNMDAMMEVQQRLLGSRSSEHRKSKKHKKEKRRHRQERLHEAALSGSAEVNAKPAADDRVPVLSDETQICSGALFPMQENLSLSNSSLSMFPSTSTNITVTNSNRGAMSSSKKLKSDLTFAGKFKKSSSNVCTTGAHAVSDVTLTDTTSTIPLDVPPLVDNGQDTSYATVINPVKKTKHKDGRSSIVVIESRSCSPFTPIGGNSNETSTSSSRTSNRDLIEVVNQESQEVEDVQMRSKLLPQPQSHQQKPIEMESSVPEENKIPKRRGRKKGSKGADAMLAQFNTQLFEGSRLLSLASLSGNKKVKTTKELLADIQSRKFESTTSSPTLPFQSRPPSTSSEPSLHSPSTSDACSTNATMSTVARSTPDENLVIASNYRTSGLDEDSASNSSEVAVVGKKGSIQFDHDLKSISKVEGMLSIEEDIKMLVDSLPPINRENINWKNDEDVPCTCTVREIPQVQQQKQEKTPVQTKEDDENEMKENDIRIFVEQNITKSVRKHETSSVSVPRALPPVKVKLQLKPVKSIFDLDYDEENDPLRTFVEAAKSCKTENNDDDSSRLLDIKDTSLEAKPQEDVIISVSLPMQQKQQPLSDTAIESGNDALNNNNIELVQPTLAPPVFPQFELLEDPNCLAKERYEIRTVRITKFHVDALHNCYIPSVNGNWDDAEQINSDDDGCSSIVAYDEMTPDGLYKRVVPQYNFLIRDRIPKDLSHVQFTKTYNKIKNLKLEKIRNKRKRSLISTFSEEDDETKHQRKNECTTLEASPSQEMVNKNVIESDSDHGFDKNMNLNNCTDSISANSKTIDTEKLNADRMDYSSNDVANGNDDTDDNLGDVTATMNDEINATAEPDSMAVSGRIISNSPPPELATNSNSNHNSNVSRRSSNCSNSSVNLNNTLSDNNNSSKPNNDISNNMSDVGDNSVDNEELSYGHSNFSEDCEGDDDAEDDDEYDDDDDEDYDDHGDFHEVVTHDMTSSTSTIGNKLVLTIKKTPSKVTPQSSPSLTLSIEIGRTKKRKITSIDEDRSLECTLKAEEKQNVMAVETANVDSCFSENENLNRPRTVLERDKLDPSEDPVNVKAPETFLSSCDGDNDYFNDIKEIKTSVEQHNGDVNEKKICSSPSDTNQGDLITVIKSSPRPLSHSLFELKSRIDQASATDDENIDDSLTVENNQLLPSFNSLGKENSTGLRVDTRTGKPQQFKEWHEVLQVRSYNDELLTILPYVVID